MTIATGTTGTHASRRRGGRLGHFSPDNHVLRALAPRLRPVTVAGSRDVAS